MICFNATSFVPALVTVSSLGELSQVGPTSGFFRTVFHQGCEVDPTHHGLRKDDCLFNSS